MTARAQLAQLEEAFAPPSMLAMPYRNPADCRAAQEDAYMAWVEAREIHDQRTPEKRAADMRAAMDVVMFGMGGK